MDNGADVFGMGTGPLTDTVGKKEIAAIYALWNDQGFVWRRFHEGITEGITPSVRYAFWRAVSLSLRTDPKHWVSAP